MSLDNEDDVILNEYSKVVGGPPGVHVLQSAHRSVGVKRDEGKACWQGAYEVWDLISRAGLPKKHHYATSGGRRARRAACRLCNADGVDRMRRLLFPGFVASSRRAF